MGVTHRILIATSLSEAGLNLLKGEIGGLAQVVEPENLSKHPMLNAAEALIIRDEVEIDTALLEKMPKLRVIGRAGVGIAGIDVESATRRGIIVMNTPGVNAISTAEYTFTLMLAMARNLIQAHNALTGGVWKREQHVGMELHGKRLGIIGLGRVGREVARRAMAFGMTVQAYDPYVTENQLGDLRLKLVGLAQLLADSDVISLHCATTPETAGLLNVDTFSLIKNGALLINTAHGSIVDENALLTALKNGRLAGVAVDVYAHEPITHSPLLNLPNVLHTPHLGDSTREAQRDLGLLIARQVLDALRGEDYRNVVNMPFVDGRPFEMIAPYLKLAERIGILQHALARGPINRVMLEFRGQEVEGLVKPMTVALLRGLLMPILGEGTVNYINAPVLAHERNIFVSQTKGLDSPDYANLMSCQVHWTGQYAGSTTMAGALFGRTEAHIVKINQYRTDFQPEGVLLVIGSYDRPGVIGRVGLLLSENNINIADWRTGRAEPGGQTLSVAILDEPISDDLLETLRSQDYVRHATQIVFSS
ncbi:MAG: D-3-phosphoglycerate dehydrogenase [Chloroflexota bacterium]|nr:MAG: D-3-phosphoglycerate dehydrogenase [Chloroflexota bacterium]